MNFPNHMLNCWYLEIGYGEVLTPLKVKNSTNQNSGFQKVGGYTFTGIPLDLWLLFSTSKPSRLLPMDICNQILFRKQQRTVRKNDFQNLSLIITHNVCSRSVSIWKDAQERSLHWHSDPGHHLRTSVSSCSSSFLLFTLSKRAWEKSETSKGMKRWAWNLTCL